jgi:hypothetical protein
LVFDAGRVRALGLPLCGAGGGEAGDRDDGRTGLIVLRLGDAASSKKADEADTLVELAKLLDLSALARAIDELELGPGRRVIRSVSASKLDIEQGWLLSHEDLTPVAPTLIFNDNRPSSFDHGCAVLGEMVAADNTVGVIGIASDAGRRGTASDRRTLLSRSPVAVAHVKSSTGARPRAERRRARG